MTEQLQSLTPGMQVLYGGDKVTTVSDELAAAFKPGDRLVVVQTTGDLLHIPGDVWDIATGAVGAAHDAFEKMGSVSDTQISQFYDEFASRLDNEATFAPIAEANEADIAAAKERGRSTTRLRLSDVMRKDMIDGLAGWRDMETGRGKVLRTVESDGWNLELLTAGLGPVGFVFEGRPNVFADATGVLRSGNTVVFRIGSDALGTAKAIVEHALDPALEASGLPAGAASLVASASRAAGYAMFSDTRLALAVARGSGPAVAQLGAVAKQSGVPVSLHGTGGAWIVVGQGADAEWFADAVYHSLDRKVCNTLNTCCIPCNLADEFVPVFLDAMDKAGERLGVKTKLHVIADQADGIPASWFDEVTVGRAEGNVIEPRTSTLGWDDLGHEWEWEESPEVTLAIVDSVDHAVQLFNESSPQFAACLISADQAEQDSFYETVNAPFVGNGFTRWVDGQYALKTPELGLSNWQTGRLFGRGGVLSGDSVYTVRTRLTQDNSDIGR